ncbi:MAG: nicotinate-nucleotide adenylyltransferase [Bacteroidales bacterium]|nr:nicotinate-nucleotide adenylyltransferase [Bacteroidales bacterium]MCF8454565.1 nicotinate-nucleotide adenylyltransferase [Bacteroidales bacterium]
MKKTGLFFGSFNPVHIGHTAIANYMVEFTDLDQLWFVVSPQNPFKKKSQLLPEYHRLELVNLAIGDSPLFKATNVEFKLPQPSYTIDTLVYLQEKYPDHEFVLIVGSDNLPYLHKWKNYQQLLDNYELYIYPRPEVDAHDFVKLGQLKIVDAPLIEISSSFIRTAIRNKKNVEFFLPCKVAEYMKEMHFYE